MDMQQNEENLKQKDIAQQSAQEDVGQTNTSAPEQPSLEAPLLNNSEEATSSAASEQEEESKKNAEEDVDLEYYLDKGWIHARVIIQIAGSPKEHVEKTLEAMVNDIKKYVDIKLVSSDIEEATSEDGKIFTAFAECEIIVKEMPLFLTFILEYMPASVEILAPSHPITSLNVLNGFLNDFLGKIHQVSMDLKETNAKLVLLNKNANALLYNLIHFLLSEGPKTLAELSKKTGIEKRALNAFLQKRIDEGKLVVQDDKYMLKNG